MIPRTQILDTIEKLTGGSTLALQKVKTEQDYVLNWSNKLWTQNNKIMMIKEMNPNPENICFDC